jgi:hypothetical protein
MRSATYAGSDRAVVATLRSSARYSARTMSGVAAMILCMRARAGPVVMRGGHMHEGGFGSEAGIRGREADDPPGCLIGIPVAPSELDEESAA